MEGIRRRLTKQIWNAANSYVALSCKRSVCRSVKPRESPFQNLLGVPWLALQCRGIKITGTDVKVGNVIEKNGCLYEVIKAQHTQHGRGGATMQVELRDLESGLKLTERLRTSEPIEKVHLEDRTFTFLYEEGDTVFMMDPETFEQVELSKSIFGKRAAYLTDGIPITVSFHEGKALSGQMPIRMTCTVAEAEPSFRGQSVSAQYKKLVLENGRTIMGPTYLEAGDKIVVNTIEETYLERAAKR
ncbi:hypothetical protein SUGI_0442050 [Cryptomeria japonica]|uniref:uncharacterized protein LOC131027473 isoform X3 n=1 Tax=Cryptomeria japonica TaxID=3369 RepID=UPI002408C249|nr:uncharacterized protein LOC131027473 isoform X3 [Cryptomeria japonica]GLJ23364.1 hypothetical protein SUGI_0442050 [Cryptomeria japonica]